MKVVLSGVLLRFADHQKELELDAPTVGGALEGLMARHPRVRPVLLDGDGRLRATHSLFLNEKALGGARLDQGLGRTDVLEIVTAIAGG